MATRPVQLYRWLYADEMIIVHFNTLQNSLYTIYIEKVYNYKS